MVESPPPETWASPELRRALAARDITTVYRLLTATGVTQRQIAQLTGQQQSEVGAVLRGRSVRSYELLARIADGLGVLRGSMGLAYTDADRPEDSSPGECSHPVGEVDEDVKRRAFLAAASLAVVGRPVLGELLELPSPPTSPTPLPSRLGMADVAAVRDLTEQFRVLGRLYGGMSDVVSPVANRAERLLSIPSSEPAQRALFSALAELHILAGWCAYDAALIDHARHHYRRALDLAGRADDVNRLVSALNHAAVMDREHGGPNDALKLYQLARVRLMDEPAGSLRVAAQQAWLHVQSASALALMDRPDDVPRELAQAGDCDALLDTFDQADMNHLRAVIHLDLGRLDVAEQYATGALRTWTAGDRRDAALTRILLATIHARAGEPDTARLAATAINSVAELRSARARNHLKPLAHCLNHRDSTCQDLANRIRLLPST